jgi:iron complex outermembrane recepter protein
MQRFIARSGAAIAVLAFPAIAAAQTVDVPESADSGLETVLVIGQRSIDPAPHLAGSLDVLGRDELEYAHVDDTMELFTKVPGVYFSRFNQGIVNTDISIRGFAGDGTTPHAKLLIDGLPANLHNGNKEMDQFFPLGIGSAQVFKGTSDARYGLHNIAGSYELTTRRDVDIAELEATVGSYDTREVQGYWGLESGSLTHNYFAGYRQSEGYRDNTDLEKFAASGRWAYSFSGANSLALHARVAGYEGDAPGYLPLAVARSQPRSSAAFASEDGGDKQTQHVSLHWDVALNDDVDLTVKGYWQNFERERWVRFTAAGSLQNRFEDEDQTGAAAKLAWRFNDQWALTIGADAEYQDNLEQRFGTIGNVRVRNAQNVLRNFDFSYDTRGGYIQIDHAPNRFVSWNAAIRADRIDGDFVSFNAAGVGTARSIFDFGTIVQPKLNVFVAPTDDITLFANYGRSFQHPIGSAAFATGPTNARDVSINDGAEIGIKWQVRRSADVRLSYWEQRASDEFVTVDGTPQNVGKTHRKGFDAAATWQASERLSLWANYTTIDSEIVRTDTSQVAFVGNELRGIPEFAASLGASFAATDALSLRLHVDAQGDYFVNEANLGGQFGDYAIVGATLDYRAERWNVSLQLNNLFDEFYEYVFDFSPNGTDTIHSPGDGMNASLTFGLRF